MLGLLWTLTTSALGAPVEVQFGAHVDGNHSQGYGLSRVGVGLDATLRYQRVGVELAGLALTHHENGLMITTEAGLFGTALRISTGRAGALRLRVRSMARLARTGFDPAVPTYQRRLDVRAAPDVGWTVRL
jgi:hypothetical protein